MQLVIFVGKFVRVMTNQWAVFQCHMCTSVNPIGNQLGMMNYETVELTSDTDIYSANQC